MARWQNANWIGKLDLLPGLNLHEKARARVIILSKPREDRELYFEGTYAEAAATIRALLRETPIGATSSTAATSSVDRPASPSPSPSLAPSAPAAASGPQPTSSTAGGKTTSKTSTTGATAANAAFSAGASGAASASGAAPSRPPGPGSSMGAINAATLSRATGATDKAPTPSTAGWTAAATAAAAALAASASAPAIQTSASRVRWGEDSVIHPPPLAPPPAVPLAVAAGPPPLGGWERSFDAAVAAGSEPERTTGMPHWSVIWARAMSDINQIAPPTTAADFASASTSASATPRASDTNGLTLTFQPTLSFGLNDNSPAALAAARRAKASEAALAARAAAAAAAALDKTTPSYDTTDTWARPRSAATAGAARHPYSSAPASGTAMNSPRGGSHPHHNHNHNHHNHLERTASNASRNPYASPFSLPHAYQLAAISSVGSGFSSSSTPSSSRPPASALLVQTAANVRHLGSLPSAFRAAHLLASQPGDVYCRTVRKVIETCGAGRTVQRRTRFVMVVDMHEGSTAVLVKVRCKELGRRSLRPGEEAGGGGSSQQCYRTEVVPDPADTLPAVLARLDRREVRVADILMWKEAPAGWRLWDGSPQEASVLFERA